MNKVPWLNLQTTYCQNNGALVCISHCLLCQCIEARPCDPLARCINLSPGYECTDCRAGYKSPPVRGKGLEHAIRNRQVW